MGQAEYWVRLAKVNIPIAILAAVLSLLASAGGIFFYAGEKSQKIEEQERHLEFNDKRLDRIEDRLKGS